MVKTIKEYLLIATIIHIAKLALTTTMITMLYIKISQSVDLLGDFYEKPIFAKKTS